LIWRTALVERDKPQHESKCHLEAAAAANMAIATEHQWPLVKLEKECVASFGLKALARLAMCNKQLQTWCQGVVHSCAKDLLLHTLANAQQVRNMNKLQHGVAWVVHLAPGVTTAAGVAEAVVQIPMLPRPIAVQLVEAGVRVSFVKLLDAAQSMVAGVEVWVQVQWERGVSGRDIPEAAASICRGGYFMSFVRIPESMLQLALNCSDAMTASSAAQQLPEQLEPDMARLLFATAATRRHTEAVQYLAGLQCMQQHVDVTTLLTALEDLRLSTSTTMQ
jgi:hypothetical protein